MLKVAPDISRSKGSCHWGLWILYFCTQRRLGICEFRVQPAYRSICPGCSPVEDTVLGEMALLMEEIQRYVFPFFFLTHPPLIPSAG